MEQTIIQVDAFTDEPFRGNPAGVCVLSEPRDAEWMQQVAAEMNLSETAFLLRQDDGFQLSWFTPTVEVELCGHATLASAHVLWQEGHLAPDAEARFSTLSGLLTARRNGEWIELNFPADPTRPVDPPSVLAEALGVPIAAVEMGRFDYLVEVENELQVRDLKPNLALLQQIPARGIVVTSRANPEVDYDFVSRFFGPRVGVSEDPVTGSAHCALAPYWSQRLQRSTLLGYQASRRGGLVRVQLQGDRVILGGQAVTVFKGTLFA
ncbi:PhzF family phenazine biosynthesis protein [Dictyobacter aurantiacus]|uniref:Phenazine biosynthesis protein n=1 Tax=Dictyobacter aurantiacus TaxID=1936993 RepID=A0A401ZGK5_9CHLR|nr:PhzF family phenazine biosynthesis protein [Dictyobacter aurantiacus]GCE05997.1 phenazine biosynthesis protein [Dictyobacter aurantiacus]